MKRNNDFGFISFIIILVMLMALLLLIDPIAYPRNQTISSEQDNLDICEWISPDGVHYWLKEGYRIFSLTPRFDADGELVIER